MSLPVEAGEGREFHSAGAAPACPEGDGDRFTATGGQADVPAIQRFELEFGRGLADELGNAAGTVDVKFESFGAPTNPYGKKREGSKREGNPRREPGTRHSGGL